MGYRISDHARYEMQRRGINQAVLDSVMLKPEQTVTGHRGRTVRQSRVTMDGVAYLVRAVVEGSGDNMTVVTAYRTSRIERYWKPA